MAAPEVQSAILQVLREQAGHITIGAAVLQLVPPVRDRLPKDRHISEGEVLAGMWALIAQGLAYIDTSYIPAETWRIRLTDTGEAAARDEEANPDDPSGYARRLDRDVPDISPTVRSYAIEALRAYTARLPRSSAVMLGVASEAAMLEVAASLGRTLSGNERAQYEAVLSSKKQNYIVKFEIFRKKLHARSSVLPEETRNGLDLTLNSVLDLLRLYRNEAGHPHGITIDPEDAFIHLRMFVRYATKLYDLKRHFEANAVAV